MDTDASSLPEVPEDHEVPVAGARYKVNTQKTPYCAKTMDLDVANID